MKRKDLLDCDGKAFTAKVNGDIISGRIRVDESFSGNTCAFLLQNHINGNVPKNNKDFLGYQYSYNAYTGAPLLTGRNCIFKDFQLMEEFIGEPESDFKVGDEVEFATHMYYPNSKWIRGKVTEIDIIRDIIYVTSTKYGLKLNFSDRIAKETIRRVSASLTKEAILNDPSLLEDKTIRILTDRGSEYGIMQGCEYSVYNAAHYSGSPSQKYIWLSLSLSGEKWTQKCTLVWDINDFEIVEDIQKTDSADMLTKKSKSSTENNNTKTKINGKSILPRKTPGVRRGQTIEGHSVSGKASKTSTRIGHLGYTGIRS